MYKELILIFVSILSGILSSISGILFTSLITVTLIVFNMLPNIRTVIGTMMFVLICPVFLFSVIAYNKKSYVNFYYGIIIALSIFCGSWIGSNIELNYLNLTNFELKIIIASLLLIIDFILVYSIFFSNDKK